MATQSQKNTIKIPPHNADAEQSVLGSILIDKNSIHRVADMLVPDDFYMPAHETIYRTIIDLYEHRKPIDILSVTNALKEKKLLQDVGGSGYLADLTNQVTTSSHVDHYAQIVKEKKILRDLIRASAEITEHAFDQTEEFEDLVDGIEQRILAISQKSLPQNFVQLKDELKTAYERIEKLHAHQGSIRGVPTGFRDLDNLLSGLQKSDLVVLGARPSLGKTSFAMDIARNAALGGFKVGVFSLEMSREQVIDRLISSTSGVPLWKLRTGRITDENDFQLIQASLDKLSGVTLFIEDTPSPTIMQMRAMARRLQVEHGLDLLVIDYLQLVMPRRNIDNMVQQVTEISRGLKGIARELNVPVLALSQLSRAVDQRDNKTPKLHDLRESGCLTGDALIMRADTGEQVTIQSLADRKDQTPIPVYSLDDKLQLVVKPLTKAFSNGKKMTYELKLRSGKTIKASANHRFYTLVGWKALEELSAGVQIATPRGVAPEAPKDIPDNELILLAHLLGDGCILPRQPFHYTSADPENISVVSDAARKLFGIQARIVAQKNWQHVYLPSPYRLTHGKHHPITDWFSKLGIGLVRSYEKVIPNSFFALSNEKVALFLRHLWATDGNISWKRLRDRKPAAAIYYASTSETLSRQVQHLLLRLGVQSTIRVNRKGAYRACYHVQVQGAAHQLRFLEQIGCFGERGRIIPDLISALREIAPNPNLDIIPSYAWHNLVAPAKAAVGMSWRDVAAALPMQYCGSSLFKAGISRSRMLRLATVLENPTLAEYATSGIYWEEIASVTPLKVEDVYDATVPETHNFIANDIVVHNSIEQDADVVMFIYRDRERTDAPAEEANLTQIIVAKHRNGPLGTVNLMFDADRTSFRSIDKRYSSEGDFNNDLTSLN